MARNRKNSHKKRVSVHKLAAYTPPLPQIGTWAGDKYAGGFGTTWLYEADYWTLRQRSSQLFRENLYARGLIRRLVTNVIHTGLTLECIPATKVLGIDDDWADDWAETVETSFDLWGSDPSLCDYRELLTWGQIQRTAWREALIDGDVLVILHVDEFTNLPKIELVNGGRIRTPYNNKSAAGKDIRHGVEIGPKGEHVAFWVEDDKGGFKRVEAYGENSKRRVAWLLYGSGDKRYDEVRGEPLLSIILLSLKEIDRYRDSAQRKAAINAILAYFIKKEAAGTSSLPVQGGAKRRTSTVINQSDTPNRRFVTAEQVPGMVMEVLNEGETPMPYSTAGTDLNFPEFEKAILAAIAWAHEVPPSILTLTNARNYSASQGEKNDFEMFLVKIRSDISPNFQAPVYIVYLRLQILSGRTEAPGFFDAENDPRKWDIKAAWFKHSWAGAIKKSTDLRKESDGYSQLCAEGWITNARAARELTGTKFRDNIKKIARENQMKADAIRPLLELENEFGPVNTSNALKKLEVYNDEPRGL